MIRNVVFMGTPDFAVGTLEALLQSGKYDVKAVFSQPDRPKGRKKELLPTPVKALAQTAQIPVYQPEKIREPQWTDLLRQLKPDVIVVAAYGQIIPQSILDLPPYGCINVHASLLPAYRGAAPVQWAVIRGEKESGVTTMRMDAGLDTGDMILKKTVPLAKDETAGSLFDRLSEAGAALLLDTLDALSEGRATFGKQPAESPTPYAAMLRREDGCIDWGKSAHAIACQVRGMNPWPCAWTRRDGKLLKIWAADETRQESGLQPDVHPGNPAPLQNPDAAPRRSAAGEESRPLPGTVVSVTADTLLLATGDGLLALTELQPEGKKRMPVSAYLRGYPVREGEKFV